MNTFQSLMRWKQSKNGMKYLTSWDIDEIIKAQSPAYSSQHNHFLNQLNQSQQSQQEQQLLRPNSISHFDTRQPLISTRFSNSNQHSLPSKSLSFQLINHDLVELTFDFTECISLGIINIIKEFQGFYNKDTKSWCVPYRTYSNLFHAIRSLPNEHLVIKPITLLPIEIISQSSKMTQIKFITSDANQCLVDYSKDPLHSLYELPSKLLTTLYKFQKEGIEFGINKQGRLLLADEMGVGKTIQAIGISAIYKEDWPVLILCPSSLKFAWKDEIVGWLKEGLKVNKRHVQILKNGKESFNKKAKFYIMSYDLSIRNIDKIKEKKFRFVIADEAHYLKNRESKRAKLLIPILQQCKRLLLLTGTPILAKPVEAYTLLTALRPDIFHSFKEFGSRYCDPKLRKYGIDWSGSSNSKELHFILNKLMIRRSKINVLKELPPKKRQKVEILGDKKIIRQIKSILIKDKTDFDNVDLDNEALLNELTTLDQQSHYHTKDNKAKNKDNDENKVSTIDADTDDTSATKENKLTSFTHAYYLTGLAKIPGIRDYITYLIDNSCKFLIFAHHIEVLNAIEQAVISTSIDYIRIDGSIPLEKRHELVHKYQHDDNCLVAILAITTCATGLTLTKASTVVFAELHFTPAIMFQAEDRAHRIGQEHQCVNVHYLYSSGTVDEVVFKKLQEKQVVVSSTLDNKASGMNLKEIDEKIGDFEKNNACEEKDNNNQDDMKEVDNVKMINMHESNRKRIREYDPIKHHELDDIDFNDDIFKL